jgi:hypothetical protein
MQREEEKRGKYRRRRRNDEEEIGEKEGKGRWKMKESRRWGESRVR